MVIFLGFALLASAIIANKVVLLYLPPIFFVGIRMLGAGILLLVYYWGRTHRISWHYFKRDLPILLSISLLTTLLPSILKAYALKHMLSAKFSLLGSIDPFVTAFYAYILWREQLTINQIIGMVLAFISLIFLIITTISPSEGNLIFNVFSYPELAALAAPMLGRIGWLLVQHLLRSERYTAGEINGLTMFGSGASALMLSYPTESWAIALGSQWPTVSFAMLYTIVVGNIIALTMYAKFLKTHSAVFVALAGFSVNFFVVFYGWLLLGEIPPLSFFIALVVMFIGFYIFHAPSLKFRSF